MIMTRFSCTVIFISLLLLSPEVAKEVKVQPTGNFGGGTFETAIMKFLHPSSRALKLIRPKGQQSFHFIYRNRDYFIDLQRRYPIKQVEVFYHFADDVLLNKSFIEVADPIYEGFLRDDKIASSVLGRFTKTGHFTGYFFSDTAYFIEPAGTTKNNDLLIKIYKATDSAYPGCEYTFFRVACMNGFSPKPAGKHGFHTDYLQFSILPGKNNSMSTEAVIPHENNSLSTEAAFSGENYSMSTEAALPGENYSMSTEAAFAGENNSLSTESVLPGENYSMSTEAALPGENNSLFTEAYLPGENYSMSTELVLRGENYSISTEAALRGENNSLSTEAALPGENYSLSTEATLPGENYSLSTEATLSGENHSLSTEATLSGENHSLSTENIIRPVPLTQSDIFTDEDEDDSEFLTDEPIEPSNNSSSASSFITELSQTTTECLNISFSENEANISNAGFQPHDRGMNVTHVNTTEKEAVVKLYRSLNVNSSENGANVSIADFQPDTRGMNVTQVNVTEEKPMVKLERPVESLSCEVEVIADFTLLQKHKMKKSTMMAEIFETMTFVDKNLRAVDFNGDGIADKIGIVLKSIIIQAEHKNSVFSVPRSKNMDMKSYLKEMKKWKLEIVHHSSTSCLIIVMAHKNVLDSSLGYSGDSRICKKHDNILFLTSNPGLTSISQHTLFFSALVHVADAFGVEIGRTNYTDCSETSRVVNVRLGAYPNMLFTACRVKKALSVIANAGCLKTYSGTTCGDGIRQDDETCDCGPPEVCNQVDPCCTAKCKLNETAKCSHDFPCCGKDCSIVQSSANLACGAEKGMCNNATCDGESQNCPGAPEEYDLKPCLRNVDTLDSMACVRGSCQYTLCGERLFLNPCRCVPDSGFQCHQCCLTLKGKCVPLSKKLGILYKGVVPYFRRINAPCYKRGTCSSSGVCSSSISLREAASEAVRTYPFKFNAILFMFFAKLIRLLL